VEKRLTSKAVQGLLLALLAGCAGSPAPKPTDIPPSLRVMTGEVMSLRAAAKGVQVYQCRADKDDATKFAWGFKEPEADLFDAAGKPLGRHYAGPSWEAKDGSKVVGELITRSDSPQSGAIPWLLLRAKSTSGNGVFSRAKYIQRLHTAGGSAPADGCTAGSAGKEVRVPYTADYWFYADKP
jgi:hypothetical protein